MGIPSPLAALYTNKSGITNLNYPSDLGSTKMGHWLSFVISTPEKSTYAPTQVPLDTITTAILRAATPLAAVVSTITTVATVLSGGSIGSPTIGGTDNAAYNAPIPSLWQYTVMPGTTKINTVINLYAPDTISSAQHAHYAAESLSEASGFAGQVVSGAISFADQLQNGLNTDTLKTMATEGALGNLTNPTLTAAGLKALGSAINPQMEVFFKDIDFRTFQFDFLFTPKNADEAKTVQAIIQAFKFHAAPEIQSTASAGGRYYVVPSVFEIQMYKDGQPNLNVNKYGVCACETVNVDYAPQGWVTHDDGMPVQTRMTLQFKEMEIMTKEKITLGY